jgi:hypothetical protein
MGETDREQMAVVAIAATVEDAAFVQQVLAAAAIASWREASGDAGAGRWRVLVTQREETAALRRLRMVPDV